MTGPNGCYTKPFFNTGNVYGHFYGHNGQGSPYEPMPSSHPQHFDVISHLYLQICCADTKCYGRLAVVSDLDDGGFALNVDKELRGSAVLY
jgi:hypothetical protein